MRFLAPQTGLTCNDIGNLWGDLTGELEARGAAWKSFAPGPRPRIVAVDPGGTTGWAIVDPDGDVEFGMFPGKEALCPRWQVGLEELFAKVNQDQETPTLVVVEDAYLDAGYLKSKRADRPPRGPFDAGVGGSPTTLRVLGYRIGAVATMAAANRLPVWRVLASVWQSAMIGHVRREQGKALSMAKAKDLTGKFFVSDHEADATLLGLWAHGPLRRPLRGVA